jgi:hypothetical protein
MARPTTGHFLFHKLPQIDPLQTRQLGLKDETVDHTVVGHFRRLRFEKFLMDVGLSQLPANRGVFANFELQHEKLE